jgi:hypothetical protein
MASAQPQQFPEKVVLFARMASVPIHNAIGCIAAQIIVVSNGDVKTDPA